MLNPLTTVHQLLELEAEVDHYWEEARGEAGAKAEGP